ncbi:MAG: Ca-activated chloride channel [Blastocatellia bacterium]|jgi:Ca-activated chloride channel family protein|nr:Ca-activated chloride channel [Blastocatellia bacterium]
MKSRRYVEPAVLAACMILTVAFAAAPLAIAQQKPEDKPAQPTEKKDLLKVEPAAQPTPPDATPKKSPQKTDTRIQLPGGDVDDKNPVITNTDLITFTVTVTDIYGRFVSGLGQKAFTIFDDKAEQNITFFSDDDSPVSVGILFDVSGSMSGDKVRRARDALGHFVQTSHDRDEYFLIGFNSRAQLLMDRTRDGNAVLDKLTFVQTKNNTALYDACYLGVERVQRGTHPKRALLLISDGQDNNSRYTFNELRRVLKESDVVLYAIGILGGSDVGSSLGMEGQGIMDELAGVSGGKAFYPRSNAEMDDIFEQIALELRHQYSIGYRPPNFTNDGKWHKIKVKVAPPRGLPRLFVRSKEGYFAIANPK